jgi:5-methylcytosine-specific restriction endonuclease McrA
MPWGNSPKDRRRSSAAYGAAYRRNRDECLRRASWRCQLQLPGICIGAATQCDHILAVADGGGHELRNLRAACTPCHNARTAQQGGGFRRNGQRGDPPAAPRTTW